MSPDHHKEIISFETKCSQRIEYAVETTVNEILNSDTPVISVGFGPMAGGKSTFLGETRKFLASRFSESELVLFNLEGDSIRSPEGPNTMWTRNGEYSNVIPIKKINEANSFIEEYKSRIVLFNEPTFMGTPEEVAHEISDLKNRGISVVLGCLGAWFTGEPIDQVKKMLSLADIAFCMQSYCVFDPTQAADGTLRTVRFTEDGKILDKHGINYEKLLLARKKRLFNIIANSKYFDILVYKEPNGRQIARVPSHPNDPLIAIGHQEYFPISAEKFNELYEHIEIDPPNNPPITELYKSSAIVNWPTVGL